MVEFGQGVEGRAAYGGHGSGAGALTGQILQMLSAKSPPSSVDLPIAPAGLHSHAGGIVGNVDAGIRQIERGDAFPTADTFLDRQRHAGRAPDSVPTHKCENSPHGYPCRSLCAALAHSAVRNLMWRMAPGSSNDFPDGA